MRQIQSLFSILQMGKLREGAARGINTGADRGLTLDTRFLFEPAVYTCPGPEAHQRGSSPFCFLMVKNPRKLGNPCKKSIPLQPKE